MKKNGILERALNRSTFTTEIPGVGSSLDDKAVSAIVKKNALSEDATYALQAALMELRTRAGGKKINSVIPTSAQIVKSAKALSAALEAFYELADNEVHHHTIGVLASVVNDGEGKPLTNYEVESAFPIAFKLKKLCDKATNYRAQIDKHQKKLSDQSFWQKDLIGRKLPLLYCRVTGKSFGATTDAYASRKPHETRAEVKYVTGVAFVVDCYSAMGLSPPIKPSNVESHWRSCGKPGQVKRRPKTKHQK